MNRRQHYQEAERLAKAAQDGCAGLSKLMDKISVSELSYATQQLQLTAQLAQVHATLATVERVVPE